MLKSNATRQSLRFIRRATVAAATIFASLVISLLLLEIGVRVWHGIPVASTENFVARELDAIHKEGGPGMYDARLGWVTRPNTGWDLNGKRMVTFGDYGARMSSTQVVPLQEGAVLLVGDSFGAGAEVPDSESWPAQLERMIGTQVINATVGGYGFDQIVLYAEYLLPRLKPRMLLVQTRLEYGISVVRMSISGGAPKPYFLIRDGKLVLNNEPVPRTAKASKDIGRLRAILGYSYLVQYVMTRLDLLQWWVSPAMATKLVLSDSEAVDVTCLLMQRVRELRDQYGIPVALVIQYSGADATAATLPWEADHTRVTGCAEHEGLQVVDILGALRAAYRAGDLESYQRLWVMHDNNRLYGHMSADGNRLVASLILQQLFNGKSSEVKAP